MAAAVTAHDLGAKVVILEKAPEGQEGGNTRVAGQGYLNTSSADQAVAYLTALCGPYTVPEAMVQAWAQEMCRNNAWLQALGGDPQEHQHPPVGIEFPDLPGSDCVHKFHDGPTYGYSYTWKLFERLVRQRPIPHPVRNAREGTDPARHHQGDPRRARPAGQPADPGQGAQGGGADLRRLRKQPGDDSKLPAWRSLLLHLRHAVQRRRRHRDGDVGRRRSLAHEQLRRPVDGAEGPGDPHHVLDAGVALQQGNSRRHDRGGARTPGGSPTKNTRPATARSR